ncbi:nuclear transport factor 2 family protein [Microbulbifer sp. Q7]|uniref:nuclear transport factor 2 family protein n=1 Tax=Microbulbifer sp. Q7 TaxID=1785091 RepID=UPI0008304FB5|nr:nuclear transport factor 2 family protein [Microbulbifer sp. Q7]
MAALVKRIKLLYSDFLAADPDSIAEVYAENVVFSDPVHRIEGLASMQAYFAGVAQNLRECRFEFDQTLVDGSTVNLWWTMHYRHPRLSGGAPLQLRGASLLSLDLETDRVLTHEDIYDLGAMVYEQVPVLGAVLRYVKRGIAESGA